MGTIHRRGTVSWTRRSTAWVQRHQNSALYRPFVFLVNRPTHWVHSRFWLDLGSDAGVRILDRAGLGSHFSGYTIESESSFNE